MAESEFMQANLYADHIGITAGVLEGWLKRGLAKGMHYVVIGHQTMIHVRRTDEWIKERGQLASDQAAKACRSGFGTREDCSTRKPFPEIPGAPVTSPRRKGVELHSSAG